MPETSASLLGRLIEQPDSESWERFNQLYRPFLKSHLERHYSLQPNDADDVTQDVLLVVIRRVQEFRHSGRRGAFRSWLRTITANQIRAFWRQKRSQPVGTGDSEVMSKLDQLEDPTSAMSQLWDLEHDRHVLGQLLSSIEPEFKPKTWQAFLRLMKDGVPAAEVAQEFGMTLEAVYVAKSKIMRRLRELKDGLTD